MAKQEYKRSPTQNVVSSVCSNLKNHNESALGKIRRKRTECGDCPDSGIDIITANYVNCLNELHQKMLDFQ